MKITLDRLALKALIDADPEFEVELKASVLAEVGRRFFEKDAARIISAAQPELFAQVLKGIQEDSDLLGKIEKALNTSILRRSDDWYGRMKLSPELKAKVEEYVSEMKRRVELQITSQIENAYNEAIQKALAAKFEAEDIEERIQKRVARLVEQEIAHRADQKFKARMADLKAMMS